MRRRHNHKRKNQRKIIIISLAALFFIMSAGYAAFSTNLNITAKGTIKFDEACTIGNEWTYDYKDNTIYDFPAPCRGTYKLETWGAQGGNTTYDSFSNIGGYGGYSTGNIKLNKNEILYINIGEQGGGVTYTSSNDNAQFDEHIGYNGGGYAAVFSLNSAHAGGGGATHIAKKSGLLSTFVNDKSSVIVVAGGGGGASTHFMYPSYSGTGGSGGGYNGGSGITANDTCYNYGTGGSQSSTGIYIACNNDGNTERTDVVTANPSFGLGANYNQNINERYYAYSGGGSGYYGGQSGWHAPGGGGSGYIGNTLLTDKVMYCYNCAESTEEFTKTISTTNVSETPISNSTKKGNGYAKITLVSRN